MSRLPGKPFASGQSELFGTTGRPSPAPQPSPGGEGRGRPEPTSTAATRDDDIGADAGAPGAPGAISTAAAGATDTGRTLSFSLDGQPSVIITVRETGDGGLSFTVAVDTSSGMVGDLRGLFFHVGDENLLGGLTVAGDDVTDSAATADAVSDLGHGANVRGVGDGPFDVGVEIGTRGIAGDDIQTTTFVLTHDSVPLTLELIAGQDFAVRMTSVGTVGEDGDGREDSLKLSGSVPPIDTNQAPDARDDLVATDEDTVLSGNVLVDNGHGPDGDPDGDPLTVNTTPVSGPGHGTLVLEADGSFTYVPDRDFYGEDAFVYEVSDGRGGTDAATVTIVVAPVNDDPVAEPDRLGIVESEQFGYVGSLDVVTNDHDVDNPNEALFVFAINGHEVQPGDSVDLGYGAFVTLQADGRTVAYADPLMNGPFDFSYTVADGAGGEATALVTVDFADDPLFG
ncbi:MAG: Ig-like domain-containing protein [Rhodospirillales bacterium]